MRDFGVFVRGSVSLTRKAKKRKKGLDRNDELATPLEKKKVSWVQVKRRLLVKGTVWGSRRKGSSGNPLHHGAS